KANLLVPRGSVDWSAKGRGSTFGNDTGAGVGSEVQFMSDESNAGAAAPAADNKPSFNLLGQYIKDLSFENPGAPGSTLLGGGAPNFNVGINVGVKKQAEEVYAVEITLNAKADRDSNVLFN